MNIRILLKSDTILLLEKHSSFVPNIGDEINIHDDVNRYVVVNRSFYYEHDEDVVLIWVDEVK